MKKKSKQDQLWNGILLLSQQEFTNNMNSTLITVVDYSAVICPLDVCTGSNVKKKKKERYLSIDIDITT